MHPPPPEVNSRRWAAPGLSRFQNPRKSLSGKVVRSKSVGNLACEAEWSAEYDNVSVKGSADTGGLGLETVKSGLWHISV